jgi:NhaP-type Na+/H+ or K+/H+ antiporter
MDLMTVLIALGLLIFLAHIFDALFSSTRIPSVLWLMLIGLVIGPVLKLVTPDFFGRFGSVFTTLTLITILFESGTNLRFGDLKKALLGATALTLINFLFMLAAGALTGRLLLDMSWLHSLFLGAVRGGTSSAVVIPMVDQLKPGRKTGTILYLESALSDVLCLVVALALLENLQTGEASMADVFRDMGYALLLAIVIGFFAGMLWIIILKKWLNALQNNLFTTFAFAFILYGVLEKMQINGGIGVLTFGITVGNIGAAGFFRRLFKDNEAFLLNREEKNFYAEIVFILQTYFFVYIGLSIQLQNTWHIVVGALLVAMSFGFRTISCRTVGKKDISARDRNLLVALGPKGLVAAVLATLPLDSAHQALAAASQTDNFLLMDQARQLVESGEAIRDTAYAVVFISILVSSVLVFLFERKKHLETAKNEDTKSSEITEN